nr:probable prolyl 4-hydroxylase 12 [Tanacetum cinerariifolium]
YNAFLSDQECQHLISLGNDNNKSSGNSSAKAMEGASNLDISLEIKQSQEAQDQRTSFDGRTFESVVHVISVRGVKINVSNWLEG